MAGSPRPSTPVVVAYGGSHRPARCRSASPTQPGAPARVEVGEPLTGRGGGRRS